MALHGLAQEDIEGRDLVGDPSSTRIPFQTWQQKSCDSQMTDAANSRTTEEDASEMEMEVHCSLKNAYSGS